MNIAEFIAEVQDNRKARGKKYQASSVLNLMLAGLMSNKNNIKAIHRFGLSLSKTEVKKLGFKNGKIPCYSNMTIMLQKIDMGSLKFANADLMDALRYNATEVNDIDDRLMHVDGKTLRNSNTFCDKIQSKILTIFWSKCKAVYDFLQIYGDNEYGAMMDLLSKAELNHKIITADAAFCHEEVCESIVSNMADFALTLKGNEGNLHYYANKAFESDGVEISQFEEEWDSSHGRIEKRRIEVMEMPFEYLNGFKNIKQICRITRERDYKGKSGKDTKESVLMVTSLGKEYDPKTLLYINRKHWNCENNLNWVKDAIFLEDNSTVSKGTAPILLSCLRSMAIAIINSISEKITETREMFNNNKAKLFRFFDTIIDDF